MECPGAGLEYVKMPGPQKMETVVSGDAQVDKASDMPQPKVHLQDGVNMEQAGNQDNQEDKHNAETCHHMENQLTGCVYQGRRDIAEKVVEHIGPTEAEPKDVSPCGWRDSGNHRSRDPQPYRYTHVLSWWCYKVGVAHCCVAVIGH